MFLCFPLFLPLKYNSNICWIMMEYFFFQRILFLFICLSVTTMSVLHSCLVIDGFDCMNRNTCTILRVNIVIIPLPTTFKKMAYWLPFFSCFFFINIYTMRIMFPHCKDQNAVVVQSISSMSLLCLTKKTNKHTYSVRKVCCIYSMIRLILMLKIRAFFVIVLLLRVINIV